MKSIVGSCGVSSIWLKGSLMGAMLMRRTRRAVVCLAVATLLAMSLAAPATAGPPGYLVLRRGEAPGNHYRPGYYDAAMYDARTTGYAYGFFGVAPRQHFSRHFGVYRNYTQFARY